MTFIISAPKFTEAGQGRGLAQVRLLRSTDPQSEYARMLGAWTVLPEDLRSDIIRSYSRGELTNYHRNLLKAVEIWRRLGVWRVPIDES